MLQALLLVLLTAAPAAVHIGRWHVVIQTCAGTVCQTLTGVEEYISDRQCLAAAHAATDRLVKSAENHNLQVTVYTHCVDESPDPHVA